MCLKGITQYFSISRDWDRTILHPQMTLLLLKPSPTPSRDILTKHLQEDPSKTLIMAHIYLADHLISTLWTVFFGVVWWSYTAHDGKRITNSPAQEEVATGGASYGHHPPILTETQRTEAALELWNEEKNFAAGIIVAGWFIKVSPLFPFSDLRSPGPVSIHSNWANKSSNKSADGLQLYFIVIIYAYAQHLRHGTYRTLPLSRPTRTVGYVSDTESEDEDTHLHDLDDFHQPYPPRANGHGNRYSANKERASAGEVVFDAEAGSSLKVNTPRPPR
jgi:hypothetical protein